MYVVVHHRIRDPKKAFPRGEKLLNGDGAPDGVRVLQFYPATDGSLVTCLWEAPSVDSVQDYVDSTLGDASENACYQVDEEQARADQPSRIRELATT